VKKLIILILPVTFLFQACKNEIIVDPPPNASAKGAYVLNEGLFQQNNSSLTYYNFDDGSVIQNAYSLANNNQPLGDAANSMVIYNGKGYIAVDNSDKIEIINLNDFTTLGFIDFGQNGSPREIFIKDSTAGYATSLKPGEVVKFNPSSKEILKRIKVGDYPEGIAAEAGKLFVANSGFGMMNTVSVIDLSTDEVVKTLTVGFNPRTIVKSGNGNIYVVCSGSFSDTSLFSGVYEIDPVAAVVLDSIEIKNFPGEACSFGSSKLLVVNGEGAYEINLIAKTLSDSAFIKGSEVNNIYGIISLIYYDELTGTIFCGNPKNFTQDGEIVMYNVNGTETGRFAAGLIPGSIVIR
jgi:YVTN family beta-propeller protein